ncbi:hypothetical protein PEX1_057310 [Penicillium expansum]|uniref:Uncharacterized protein n=1 Tax=Penicillium expansum TaxID=27334 RepID=A0A0A2IHY9_PENEN|nr:hypothetical protein PEX2_067800 [Penicillium expansum]KGO42697.1 hypothetical protein PEXP_022260 [Penicillium expansum]KGO58270.1 hypothetical protein PEX2_067800 [Penicillium expansum]KGO70760.1 hypothetical protein PEX1_057310 [Penicillium expansum]
MDSCTPFQGNSDLYGLGIRLGVYLQWISAWISLLLDPHSAQFIYDTNSVFVFAIMVASIIAAQQGTAAIEIYIMLQFMLGSFVTTLSTLGMRLWLMSPNRLAKLETTTTMALKSLLSVTKAFLDFLFKKPSANLSNGWQSDLSAQNEMGTTRKPFLLLSTTLRFLELCFYFFGTPVNMLWTLKPPGLSWSGVIWRMTTAAVVAAYNLIFWFDDSSSGTQQPPRQGCGPLYIFLLSKQPLNGSVVTLCRAAAIIIAIFVFPPASLLLQLTLVLLWHALLFLYRDIIYSFNPVAPQALNSALGRINVFLEKQGIPLLYVTPFGLFGLPVATLSDLLGFLATPKADAIRFSDVIKVCVSLGTGKVTGNERENTLPTRGMGMTPGWKEASFQHRTFSSLWNVYVVLSIAWFIASIEYTIHWNYIQGVHDIQTTGQLIPFVIGCVSASQVIKRLMLFAWAKKYPDWADTRLELGDGADGPIIFKIVKMNQGNDSEEEVPRDDDMGNDQFERPISIMQIRRQSV